MSNWERDTTRVIKNNLLENVFFGEVPSDIFDWLKKIIQEVKEKNLDIRTTLAGHLNQEFEIYNRDKPPNGVVRPDDTNFLKYNQFISRCSFDEKLNRFWKRQVFLTKNCELSICSTWVNFQKKYEFNPPHYHTGILSWIIFVSIPYDLEEEDKVFPKIGHDCSTSRLSFLEVKSDEVGCINHVRLNVDKSYEGKIVVFPSSQQHQVFPFYTSDDYRITISGNVFFDVDKTTN